MVGYADRVLLFFLRRRLKTPRPPAVFIRARKPIFFLRRRLLGLYDGFIERES